jgi:hypothetical protein
MNHTNKIIHGLWIGEELSPLEILTLKSFIFHGHEFHLWLYDSLKTPVPEGVAVRNANDILPENHIFRYKYASNYGHGKGSLAGFSDIFRYKLLYEKGGWWSDMDVTCQKPLDFCEPYVFRNNDVFPVVGNIMKCPKNSVLMKDSYEDAITQVTAENTDWSKPIEILNQHIKRQQLSSFIKDDICNPDIWEVVDLYRYFDVKPLKSYYVIHWMNEYYRNKEIDKNSTIKDSFLDKQMERYFIATRRIDFATTHTSSRYQETT